MKVDEFLQSDLEDNRDPGDETQEPEFEHVTSLTPSGIEVLYSWAPKRLYRLRQVPPNQTGFPVTSIWNEWRDVPSVTTVLGILDKPALPWWGMKVGVAGVNQLIRDVKLGYDASTGTLWNIEDNLEIMDPDDVVDLLTKHRLTVNHVKDKAADRGVNVHNALEAFCVDQEYRSDVDLYEEYERGYVEGLNSFLGDLGSVEDIQAEVMVGSIQYGYAGRFDLLMTIPKDVELVTKCYPKRQPKREIVPAGRVLIDLKTSKDCYPSHSLQLAAYELAAVECGYGKPDYCAVLHVASDGQYELRRTNASGDHFLSILQAYETLQFKGWFS